MSEHYVGKTAVVSKRNKVLTWGFHPQALSEAHKIIELIFMGSAHLKALTLKSKIKKKRILLGPSFIFGF